MIYGIVASEMPTVVVPTPEAGADFIAGTYNWQGTPITASQFTDKTAWIGAGGLQVPSTGPAASIIYNDIKTFLATCSWTVVIEIQVLDLAHDLTVFVVSNAGDAFWIELMCLPTGTDEWFADDTDGSDDKFCDAYATIATGIHKVAFTRTNSMLSISRNGGTAATTSDPPNTLPVVGFPMAHFYFGGFGTTNAAFNIRSFTAYTAQADSVLPTLSGA